jgi:hypothetical protein
MSAFLSIVSSQVHSAAITCIFVAVVPTESAAKHEQFHGV